jgi:hypothetical protein
VPFFSYALSYNWNLIQLVTYTSTLDQVIFDATLAAWAAKMNVTGIRPISAIQYMYYDQDIRAYGGQHKVDQF